MSVLSYIWQNNTMLRPPISCFLNFKKHLCEGSHYGTFFSVHLWAERFELYPSWARPTPPPPSPPWVRGFKRGCSPTVSPSTRISPSLLVKRRRRAHTHSRNSRKKNGEISCGVVAPCGGEGGLHTGTGREREENHKGKWLTKHNFVLVLKCRLQFLSRA